MEITDLTKSILRNKQLVIVEFKDKYYLTFLVRDVENPQVPGFPACGLTYFESYKKAQDAIIDKYKELNYYPINKGYKSIYKHG